MASILGHLTVAVRMLSRRPGLTIGRILTISIVVTAIGSVFAVASALFIRPLPFPEADRLVRAYLQPSGTAGFTDNSTPHMSLTFTRLRDRVRSFERFEGSWVGERALAGDGEPESVLGARTSAGFFAALGGVPIEGRIFTEQEVTDDVRVVVLGHGLWLRRFGGEAATGRTLLIDNEPHTIIGVLAAGFEPAFSRSEFWTPMNLRASERQVSTFVEVVGVLRTGVSTAAAQAEIDTLFPDVVAEWPDVLEGFRGGVIGFREAQYGEQRPGMLLLIAAIVGLSLLAIANLANLTLADVMFRRGDFALRVALGASRMEIATPELLQAFLIALAGATVGLAGASLLVPSLIGLDLSNVLSGGRVSIDWRVALGTVAATVAIMALAAAGPIVRFTGPELATDLAGNGSRAIGNRTSARVRTALVIVQTAMALVLLSSGALIVTTLLRASRIDPGFDHRNVVTAQIRLSANAYPSEADRARFVEQVLERVRATPGVASAGTTLNRFAVNASFLTMVQIEDAPTPDGQLQPFQFRRITPGYFEAMRIRIVRGRSFTSQDRAGSLPVAMISRSLAKRAWPEGDPVGRRIRRGTSAAPWLVIVGVADDVRDVALDRAPVDTIYTPFLQGSSPAIPIGLVVRAHGDPLGIVQDVKRAVWQVDPTQPLSNVVTLDRFLSNTLGAQRFRATLVAICGVIGLLLATIGIYAVTARSVIERRREAGVRLALGGDPRSVRWAIAASSLRATVSGVVIGVILSALASLGLRALLPEFQGATPEISLLTGAVIVTVGGLAAVAATRAAGSVDPIVALRAD